METTVVILGFYVCEHEMSSLETKLAMSEPLSVADENDILILQAAIYAQKCLSKTIFEIGIEYPTGKIKLIILLTPKRH